jgi:hypothetical protein
MINLDNITQGEQGTLTFTWKFPANLTSPATIQGAAISGVATNLDTGDRTEITGALTGTNATTVTWQLSDGDSGTPGTYSIIFKAIVTGVDTYTAAASLTIVANPSATAVQNPLIVGVTGAQRSGLDAANNLSGANPAATMADVGDGAAAAIAALGGAEETVSDEQLRNWAGQLPQLMTDVTRTDYSKSWIGTDGRSQSAGFFTVTGTVTWPDGATGHVDGIEYPEAPGILQYFTASHVASGKIVVQHPLADGVAGVTIVTPDYYIDSDAAGGDGSLADPLNSLANLPAVAGGVVAIKSGSVFEGQIVTVANLKIYRYGAGEKPLIDCTDAIVAESWSATAEQSNVYESSITFDEHPAGNQEILLLENGIRLARVVDLATCDSTPGSYVTSSDTASPATMYIHPTGSTDPAGNGSEYRFSKRIFAIAQTAQAGSNGVNMDGIRTRGGSGHNGNVQLGRSGIIRHCQIDEGSKHNAYMMDGGGVFGSIFSECFSTLTTSTTIVFNENTPQGLGVAVYDSAFKNATFRSSNGAIYSHNNTSGSFGDATMSRIYSIGNNNLCEMRNVDSISIFRPYQIAGAFLVRSQAAIAHKLNDPYIVLDINGAGIVKTNVDGSTFVIRGGYGEMTNTTNTGYCGLNHNNTTLIIENTYLFYNNATNNPREGIYTTTAKTGITIVARGNKYRGWLRAINDLATGTTVRSNNNQFCADMRNRIAGTDHLTIAAYQAATEQDLASIIGGCA